MHSRRCGLADVEAASNVKRDVLEHTTARCKAGAVEVRLVDESGSSWYKESRAEAATASHNNNWPHSNDPLPKRLLREAKLEDYET